MKKLILPLMATILLASVACNNNVTDNKGSPAKADSAATNKPVTKDIYTCPMDTDYHSDKPGTCPKCGMDLEKQNK